jgi:two-component system, NarL family, sensor histidine kinase DesK
MLKAISPKQIGWEPYVHLVWLIFLLFPFFFDPNTTLQHWLWLIPLLLLFFPVYFWTWTHSGKQQLWGIAGLTLLALLFTPLNSGASGLCIYAAAATGFAVRPKIAFRILLGILAVLLLSALLSSVPFPFILYAYTPVFLMTAIIGGINIYQAEQERTNIKLQMASEEIEHLATIAERERIARDLHDLLGHTLSVIALKSELANKLLEQNPSKAKAEMLEVERISREALSEVRSAVTGYRSKGLTAEIAHAKLALESAGVSFAYQNTAAQLTPIQESTLCLVIREAVTNIIRHAKATRCAVTLTEDENELRLELADNGQGLRKEEGSGLSGMRERVQALGGTFNLENSSGVRLRVVLPKAEKTVRQFGEAEVLSSS